MVRHQCKDERPSSICSYEDEQISNISSINLSRKDLQSLWVLNATRDASEALSCPTNLSSPNIKVFSPQKTEACRHI